MTSQTTTVHDSNNIIQTKPLQHLNIQIFKTLQLSNTKIMNNNLIVNTHNFSNHIG